MSFLVDNMSGKSCYLCGKGALKANLVSHANNKTIRRMQANLKPFRLVVGGMNQKVRLCIKCYRVERDKVKHSKLAKLAEQIMTQSRQAQSQVTYG